MNFGRDFCVPKNLERQHRCRIQSTSANAPTEETNMTAGSLDPVNTIPLRLKAIGASINFFAEYVGEASGSMSNYLTGKKSLPSEKSVKFTDAVKDLELIARAIHPAPIAFRDVEIIRSLVEQVKEGRLFIVRIEGGSLLFNDSSELPLNKIMNSLFAQEFADAAR
jgi:hypothetical protein